MKCKLCPEESNPTQFVLGKIRTIMEQEKLCFNCAFWEVHARDFEEGKDKGKVFFINGNRYHNGGKIDKNITQGFLGYGGADWIIRIKDTGQIIETNNLWHQGEVPKHFKYRMPDNAKFITIEQPERKKLLDILFPNTKQDG